MADAQAAVLATPVHGVLRSATVVLLIGSGLLHAGTVTHGAAAHAQFEGLAATGLVAVGLLFHERPSPSVAWLAAAASALAIAPWTAGQLGLRGVPDRTELTLFLPVAGSVVAGACAVAHACTATSTVAIAARWSRVVLVGTTFAIGAAFGVVVAPEGTTVVAVEAAAATDGSHDMSAMEGMEGMEGMDMGPTTTVPTSHGQHNPDVEAEVSTAYRPLDGPTRALLAEQLVAARDTAMRYPTVADATAAGLVRWGAFSLGAGAHYIVPAGGGGVRPDGTIDATNPGALLYAGTNPTSPVVGLMYTSAPVDSTVASLGTTGPEPAGFAGLNDHWHRHDDSCMAATVDAVEIVFPPDLGISAEECIAAGGEHVATTWWMLHVWVVPGWESPSGVFSHTNPVLVCAPGSTPDSRGYCEGS